MTNKGYKQSKIHRKNTGKAVTGKKNGMYGKKQLPETNEKNRQIHIGKRNKAWKGDDVGYSALHEWIRKHLGQPTKCEHCDKDNLTCHDIHWANKDHTYKRQKEDWIRLCAKCHKRYDKIFN